MNCLNFSIPVSTPGNCPCLRIESYPCLSQDTINVADQFNLRTESQPMPIGPLFISTIQYLQLPCLFPNPSTLSLLYYRKRKSILSWRDSRVRFLASVFFVSQWVSSTWNPGFEVRTMILFSHSQRYTKKNGNETTLIQIFVQLIVDDNYLFLSAELEESAL
jgi:hypothetical protein